MKAYIYSEDKLTTDLLASLLVGEGLKKLEVFDPDELTSESLMLIDHDTFLVVDTDAFEQRDVLMELAKSDVVVIFLGLEIKREELTELVSRRGSGFLLKPFSKESLQKALNKVFFARAKPEDNGVNLPEYSSEEDVKESWKSLVQEMARFRREQKRLVQASDINAIPVVLPSKEDPPRAQGLARPRVLIVESDEGFAKIVQRYLSRGGGNSVEVANTGSVGWKMFKTLSYDLLILGWDPARLNSHAIYHRIRSHKHLRDFPIIFFSDKLGAKENLLFEEDHAAALLTKPFQEKELFEAIAKTVVASDLALHFFDRILELVSKSIGTQQLLELRSALVEYHPLVVTALRVVGDFYFSKHHYHKALWCLKMAWDFGDRSLSLVTGLAKNYYRMGRHHEARTLLLRSNLVSPKNVERLCLLGEVNLALNHPQESEEFFTEALAIDQSLKKAQAGVDLARKWSGYRSQALNGKEGIDTLASQLNLVGIYLARSSNKLPDALEYYQSAMQFVYEDMNLAKLWFNVGLCYKRHKQEDRAQTVFKKAYDISGGEFEKVKKFITQEKEEQEQDGLEGIDTSDEEFL